MSAPPAKPPSDAHKHDDTAPAPFDNVRPIPDLARSPKFYYPAPFRWPEIRNEAITMNKDLDDRPRKTRGE